MKLKLLLPFVCWLLAAAVSAGEFAKPGDHWRTLRKGFQKRTHLVHIPPSYRGEPTPVVLILHGGGSNAAAMPKFTGMSKTADTHGFIAVYPNGTGRLKRFLTWNGGNCCGYSLRKNVNDVAYIKTVLKELDSWLAIDKQRIYATGISNGAIMSYLLASELSEQIAAIAPVAGPMGTESCQPKRPVPVMHFHGTLDENAPFNGGVGSKSKAGVDFYSVEHSIKNWADANGCPTLPHIHYMPDISKDGMKVTRKTWGPGRNDAEVVLFEIHGGGHTWPGHQSRFKALGPSTRDIDANELMWAFFKKHPMPNTGE